MAANKKITIMTSILSQNTDPQDLADLISNKTGKKCKVKNEVKDAHGKTVRCDLELHKDCNDQDRQDADDICSSHIGCGRHNHYPCGNHTVVDQGTFEQLTAGQAVTSLTLGTAPATLVVQTSSSGASVTGSANAAGNGGGRALAITDTDTTTIAAGANYNATYNADLTVSPDQVTSPNTTVSFDFKIDTSAHALGDVASSVLLVLGSSDPTNGTQAFLNINLKINSTDAEWSYYNGTSYASLSATYNAGAYNSVQIKNIPGGVAELTVNGAVSSVPDGGDFSSAALTISVSKTDTYSTSGAKTQPTVLIDNVKMFLS